MEDQGAILFQLVTALQEGIGERLVAMVLCGSRSRDQERKSSDWDLPTLEANMKEAITGYLPSLSSPS